MDLNIQETHRGKQTYGKTNKTWIVKDLSKQWQHIAANETVMLPLFFCDLQIDFALLNAVQVFTVSVCEGYISMGHTAARDDGPVCM